MNLKALAGHTIDLDALPEVPLVLDVGCRGFDFTCEVRCERILSRIVAMDPDPVMPGPGLKGIEFIRFALVGDNRSIARYASYSTGEGNFITELDNYYNAEFIAVPCTTILHVMKMRAIKHWHVVKLDCEGSEFGILENWPGPIADQISVEFHDSGYTPGYGPDYDYTEMFRRLAGFGYRTVKHDLSKQGEGIGHWDSLIVLG